MANAMLSVPLPIEIKAEMDRHKEIKWVEVARGAIVSKLELLDRMDALLSKSQFTKADALKHGRKISKKVLASHLK